MWRRGVALAFVSLSLVLPATASAQAYEVLVVTSAENELSAAGIAAIQAVGASNGFTVTAPSPAAVGGEFTPGNLDQYGTVIFLNTSGDVLTAAQQEAFEAYYADGGGFLGIGSAIETEADWQFLTDVLGTRAAGRTEVQSGTIKVADRVHDASKDLPEYWDRTDAWYNFTANVRGLQPRAGHRRRVGRRSRRVRDPAVGRPAGRHHRRHDGSRPSGDLVQGLPRRSLVLHRARQHRRRASGKPTSALISGARSSGRPERPTRSTATAARPCGPTTSRPRSARRRT